MSQTKPAFKPMVLHPEISPQQRREIQILNGHPGTSERPKRQRRTARRQAARAAAAA